MEDNNFVYGMIWCGFCLILAVIILIIPTKPEDKKDDDNFY